MDSSDSKSYFLSCKLHRPVFSKCLKWYVENIGKYNAVLDMKCTDNHSFEVILRNVGETFFNTVAKKLCKGYKLNNTQSKEARFKNQT